jgi:hypothetical protein
MRYSILAILAIICIACGPSSDKDSPFTFEEGEQGMELLENGKAVYFYQREPKAISEGYICNNYLHPLYSLEGDTLTEEAPPDHLHHRGIFWSWHQHYINGQRIGDGWMMDGISKEVVEWETKTGRNTASLNLKVLWSSSNFENGMKYLEEQTSIAVHPLKEGIRKIDFEISLKALLPGVSLGGSDDEKGYGGFCTRIKMPEDLMFTSSSGPVQPQTLQIVAGPWMDFSGSLGAVGTKHGLAILCHPDTPNYPAPWILRQKNSMQNIVYPGRDAMEIPTDQPVLLKYRLILHAGTAVANDLDKLHAEYSAGNL